MACRMLGLVFLLGTTSVLAILPWNDPCRIHPKRLPQRGEVETVVVNQDCQKGEIRWDYPQGTFQVNFIPDHQTSFQLCLKTGFANFIDELYTVEDGERIKVPAPEEGSDSCVSSHRDKLQLVLVAPETLYYMTSIDFRINLS